MRTKTLVLTALSSLSALGLMAQTSTNVYSLNAVGYINVTVPPGFSIVADQLWASGGNTISNVLNDTSGAFDGITYFKWTGATYSDDTPSAALNGGTGWGAGGTTDTLNPGEAVWINNPNNTNLTFTFVGTVPQGTNSVSIKQGFNLVSSVVPQAGFVSADLGFTNLGDADIAFVWTPAAGSTPGSYTPATVSLGGLGTGYNNEWSPAEPTLNVGQGFWYEASGPLTWTRVFSVNQ